jgi:hypothetical protein
MKKDRRFNFSVVSKYMKFLGLFSAAGLLIYKGEIYNDPQGSVLPMFMCCIMALCLVLTGVTWAVGESPG